MGVDTPLTYSIQFQQACLFQTKMPEGRWQANGKDIHSESLFPDGDNAPLQRGTRHTTLIGQASCSCRRFLTACCCQKPCAIFPIAIPHHPTSGTFPRRCPSRQPLAPTLLPTLWLVPMRLAEIPVFALFTSENLPHYTQPYPSSIQNLGCLPSVGEDGD